MHNGQKVVDVHGHMTTPAPFRQFLAETVAQNTPGRKLEITDEQLENARIHRAQMRQQEHIKTSSQTLMKGLVNQWSVSNSN